MRNADALADMVVQTIKQAMAPVLTRLAVAEAQIVSTERQFAAVIDLQKAFAPSAHVDMPLPDLDQLAAKAAALVPVPVAPDVADIARLAADLIPRPANGKDGEDGKNADPPDVEAIALLAADLVPVPKNGTDGRDVDLALVESLVSLNVERLLSTWPRPVDGISVTVDDVTPMIEAAVAKAASTLTSGKDGIGVTGALVDQNGNLQLMRSDGSVQDCGRVVGVGKDGRDGVDAKGKDGADGLGMDDMEVLFDGERTITFKWSRGDRVKSFEAVFPVDIYRGVWVDHKTYERGDGATWGGSLWHCNRTTTAKPGDGSKDWTLKAKRGNDGKDAKLPETPPVVKLERSHA